MIAPQTNEDERLRRWRLVLGKSAECQSAEGEGLGSGLGGGDLQMDNVLLAPHNSNASPAAWERVHWNTIRNLLLGLGISAADLTEG